MAFPGDTVDYSSIRRIAMIPQYDNKPYDRKKAARFIERGYTVTDDYSRPLSTETKSYGSKKVVSTPMEYPYQLLRAILKAAQASARWQGPLASDGPANAQPVEDLSLQPSGHNHLTYSSQEQSLPPPPSRRKPMLPRGEISQTMTRRGPPPAARDKLDLYAGKTTNSEGWNDPPLLNGIIAPMSRTASISEANADYSGLTPQVYVHGHFAGNGQPWERERTLAATFLDMGYHVTNAYGCGLGFERRQDGGKRVVRIPRLERTDRFAVQPPLGVSKEHDKETCSTPNCDHPSHFGGRDRIDEVHEHAVERCETPNCDHPSHFMPARPRTYISAPKKVVTISNTADASIPKAAVTEANYTETSNLGRPFATVQDDAKVYAAWADSAKVANTAANSRAQWSKQEAGGAMVEDTLANSRAQWYREMCDAARKNLEDAREPGEKGERLNFAGVANAGGKELLAGELDHGGELNVGKKAKLPEKAGVDKKAELPEKAGIGKKARLLEKVSSGAKCESSAANDKPSCGDVRPDCLGAEDSDWELISVHTPTVEAEKAEQGVKKARGRFAGWRLW
ncbi:hypothetical protein LTR85_001951 [Meristemomyces frigidus]|nr:hypothetical protein LTR85_001951 [Meristemomyces frigidus]